MDRLQLLIIAGVIAASGCSPIGLETVEVSGQGTTQTVSTDNPTKLIVSGMNSNVTVTESSQIRVVILSGMNSVVYLPEDMDVRIENSGMDARIVRY